MNFTESEITALEKAGWYDIKDGRAYDGWHRVIKQDSNYFEFQASMDDGEGGNWWAFNNGFPTIEGVIDRNNS